MKGLNGETLGEALFSPKGRINGWMYIFYSASVTIAYFIIVTLYSLIFKGDTILLPIILGIPLIVITTLLGIKRFHDMGKSGWNMFLTLIPLYNILVGLRLLFQLGDKEKNKYGNKPKTLNRDMKIATIVLAVFYIVMIFCGI